HLLGSRHAPRPQKPTHRPIDRINARKAAAAAAAASAAELQQQQDSGNDILDYDDPIDSHVFSDPLHDSGAGASTLIDSRIDDPADDIDADALDDTFGEFVEDAIEDTSGQTLHQRFEQDDDEDYAYEDEDDDED